MDGPKRTILGRSLAATAAIAMQFVDSGPSWAQAPATAPPPRASRTLPASAPAPRVDPNLQRTGLHHGEYASSQQSEEAPPIPAKPQPSYPPSAPPTSSAPPAAPTYTNYAPQQYAPQYAPQYMLVPVAPQAPLRRPPPRGTSSCRRPPPPLRPRPRRMGPR